MANRAACGDRLGPDARAHRHATRDPLGDRAGLELLGRQRPGAGEQPRRAPHHQHARAVGDAGANDTDHRAWRAGALTWQLAGDSRRARHAELRDGALRAARAPGADGRAQLHDRLGEVAGAAARHLGETAGVQRRPRRRQLDRALLAGEPRHHAGRVAVEREGRGPRTLSPPPPPRCRGRRRAAPAARPPSPGQPRRAARPPPPPPDAGCGPGRSSRAPTRAPSRRRRSPPPAPGRRGTARRKRSKYGRTVATTVCWSMNSETSVLYGLGARRHGRSRFAPSYQRSRARASGVIETRRRPPRGSARRTPGSGAGSPPPAIPPRTP